MQHQHRLLAVVQGVVADTANEELLEGAPLVLGHQQHSSVQLLRTLAHQLADGVTVHTAARHLNLVGDL